MNDFSPDNEHKSLPESLPAKRNTAANSGENSTQFPHIEYSNGEPDDGKSAAFPLENKRAASDSLNADAANGETVNNGEAVNEAALAEASELLSQQIIGDTPLVPPRAPLGKRVLSSVTHHHGVLLALCVLLLWCAMTLRLPGANTHLKIGERALHDVIAPRATTILDREATNVRREEAAALVTPEYDSALGAQSKALSDLGVLLQSTRRRALAFQSQSVSSTSRKTPPNVSPITRNVPISASLEAAISRVLREKTRVAAVNQLNQTLRANDLRNLPIATAHEAFGLPVSRWPLVEKAARDGLRAAYFADGHVQQIRSDADDDLALAARRIEARVNADVNANTSISSTRNVILTNDEKKLASALAAASCVPNLVVNVRKTERAKREARGAVPAVYRSVLAGSVLVEAGSVVDANKWSQLQDLDLVSPRFDLATTIARLFLCAIAVGFAAVYIARTTPTVLSSPGALWLLTLVPPLVVVAARGLLRVPFGEALLPPLVACGAMSLAILLNARVGLLCGLVTSLLCAMIAREDSTAFAAIVLGTCIGVLAVSDLATRAHIVRATFVLGVASAALAAIAGAMRETSLAELWSPAVFAGGSGAIAVWLAAGFALFLERPLGITTHLSLLELSSPDEPVMRRMQSEAPGTYTHSLMVAQLGEAGAKAVGADPLLCRVGGLYHDVGKLRRPHCFIENQSGVNVHDRLTPQLSALLIIAHVKDGLELARALRLPRPIHDVIQQHHGTDLVAYFFHRAQQNTALGLASSTESSPDEALFRYSGPRPQSKEAAIVMLADAVEASSRALPDLTPEKLEAHIKSMIAQRLHDGELAECELTMRDLSTIEKAFAHVLRGALHQRVEYPDPSRDLKSEAEIAWTRQAMRDPNSEPRRIERPKAARKIVKAKVASKRSLASASTADVSKANIESRNGAVKNGAAKNGAAENGATKSEVETFSVTPRNTLRKNRFASFAAHFSHARSSPIVVASETVASEAVISDTITTEVVELKTDDRAATKNGANGNHRTP